MLLNKEKTNKMDTSTSEAIAMVEKLKDFMIAYKNNHGYEKANITSALLDLWLSYRDTAKKMEVLDIRDIFTSRARVQEKKEEAQRLAHMGTVVKAVRSRFYEDGRCDVVCGALKDIFANEARIDFREKIETTMKKVECNIAKMQYAVPSF